MGAADSEGEAHKYPGGSRPPHPMPRVKSWWRKKKIRHRDAVILSVVSSSLLLAGQLPVQEGIYDEYLLPLSGQPLLFMLNTILVALAFMSYFAGILVLVGGINFLWGKIGRGRFLVSLGVGLSTLALMKQFALSILITGSPAAVIVYFVTTFTGLGLLVGFASYALMHEYALMLKKHARSMWRQWRSRRSKPSRRRARGSAAGRS